MLPVSSNHYYSHQKYKSKFLKSIEKCFRYLFRSLVNPLAMPLIEWFPSCCLNWAFVPQKTNCHIDLRFKLTRFSKTAHTTSVEFPLFIMNYPFYVIYLLVHLLWFIWQFVCCFTVDCIDLHSEEEKHLNCNVNCLLHFLFGNANTWYVIWNDLYLACTDTSSINWNHHKSLLSLEPNECCANEYTKRMVSQSTRAIFHMKRIVSIDTEQFSTVSVIQKHKWRSCSLWLC